ncbi:hypothetical protein LTR36_000622 [Oleoguttula mirabilis]|uniref:Uncharacterized protein n=1 Tax=Oleoguttula mirabilis TaxID=1507867 RepID=A0AAV9JRM0_9PEZI|nr:hypothetical protein LTR36_000622 [Oleoguttula mirabilis]
MVKPKQRKVLTIEKQLGFCLKGGICKSTKRYDYPVLNRLRNDFCRLKKTEILHPLFEQLIVENITQPPAEVNQLIVPVSNDLLVTSLRAGGELDDPIELSESDDSDEDFVASESSCSEYGRPKRRKATGRRKMTAPVAFMMAPTQRYSFVPLEARELGVNSTYGSNDNSVPSDRVSEPQGRQSNPHHSPYQHPCNRLGTSPEARMADDPARQASAGGATPQAGKRRGRPSNFERGLETNKRRQNVKVLASNGHARQLVVVLKLTREKLAAHAEPNKAPSSAGLRQSLPSKPVFDGGSHEVAAERSEVVQKELKQIYGAVQHDEAPTGPAESDVPPAGLSPALGAAELQRRHEEVPLCTTDVLSQRTGPGRPTGLGAGTEVQQNRDTPVPCYSVPNSRDTPILPRLKVNWACEEVSHWNCIELAAGSSVEDFFSSIDGQRSAELETKTIKAVRVEHLNPDVGAEKAFGCYIVRKAGAATFKELMETFRKYEGRSKPELVVKVMWM